MGAIHLPDSLQNFFNVVLGMKWPEGDEDELSAMSDDWLDFQDALVAAGLDYSAQASMIKEAMSGDFADQLYDQYHKQIPDNLKTLADAAGQMSDACLQTAAAIQKAKIMFVFMALMALLIVIELLSTLIGAIFVPAVEAAARIGLMAIARQLLARVASISIREIALKLTTREGLAALGETIGRGVTKGAQTTVKVAPQAIKQLGIDVAKYGAIGAGMMGGIDLVADGITDAETNRHGKHWHHGVDGQAVFSSAVLGFVGGGLFGAGRALSRGIDIVSKDFRANLNHIVTKEMSAVQLKQFTRSTQAFKNLGYTGFQMALGGAGANLIINKLQDPVSELGHKLFPGDGQGPDSPHAPESPVWAGLLSMFSRAQGAKAIKLNLGALKSLHLQGLTLADLKSIGIPDLNSVNVWDLRKLGIEKIDLNDEIAPGATDLTDEQRERNRLDLRELGKGSTKIGNAVTEFLMQDRGETGSLYGKDGGFNEKGSGFDEKGDETGSLHSTDTDSSDSSTLVDDRSSTWSGDTAHTAPDGSRVVLGLRGGGGSDWRDGGSDWGDGGSDWGDGFSETGSLHSANSDSGGHGGGSGDGSGQSSSGVGGSGEGSGGRGGAGADGSSGHSSDSQWSSSSSTLTEGSSSGDTFGGSDTSTLHGDSGEGGSGGHDGAGSAGSRPQTVSGEQGGRGGAWDGSSGSAGTGGSSALRTSSGLSQASSPYSAVQGKGITVHASANPLGAGFEHRLTSDGGGNSFAHGDPGDTLGTGSSAHDLNVVSRDSNGVSPGGESRLGLSRSFGDRQAAASAENGLGGGVAHQAGSPSSAAQPQPAASPGWRSAGANPMSNPAALRIVPGVSEGSAFGAASAAGDPVRRTVNPLGAGFTPEVTGGRSGPSLVSESDQPGLRGFLLGEEGQGGTGRVVEAGPVGPVGHTGVDDQAHPAAVATPSARLNSDRNPLSRFLGSPATTPPPGSGSRPAVSASDAIRTAAYGPSSETPPPGPESRPLRSLVADQSSDPENGLRSRGSAAPVLDHGDSPGDGSVPGEGWVAGVDAVEGDLAALRAVVPQGTKFADPASFAGLIDPRREGRDWDRDPEDQDRDRALERGFRAVLAAYSTWHGHPLVAAAVELDNPEGPVAQALSQQPGLVGEGVAGLARVVDSLSEDGAAVLVTVADEQPEELGSRMVLVVRFHGEPYLIDPLLVRPIRLTPEEIHTIGERIGQVNAVVSDANGEPALLAGRGWSAIAGGELTGPVTGKPRDEWTGRDVTTFMVETKPSREVLNDPANLFGAITEWRAVARIRVEAERVGDVDAERLRHAKTIVGTLLRESDLRRVRVFDEVVGLVASRLDPADLDRDEAATVAALEIGNDLGARRNGQPLAVGGLKGGAGPEGDRPGGSASGVESAGEPVTATVDRFRWLEEVTGGASAAWVRARNAETLAELAHGDRFEQLSNDIREARNSPRTVGRAPTRRGEYFYLTLQGGSSWWGRVPVAEYSKERPPWDFLIRGAQLAEAVGKDWRLVGEIMRPDYRRALLKLSRGGSVKSVVREFDLERRVFVENGFQLDEAWNRVAWIDDDRILVATDFGEGSLTRSGYPRVVKEWRRGTPLAEAETVYEGQPDDVAVSVYHQSAPGYERDLIIRKIDRYRKEWFLRTPEKLIRIDVPGDAMLDEISSVHRDWMLLHLRSPWTVAGREYRPGTLLAANFDAYLRGERDVTVLFEPDLHTALESYKWTRDHLLLTTLRDVRTEVHVLTPGENGWRREPLAGVPAMCSAEIVNTDPDNGNGYLLKTEGFTQPSTLISGHVGGEVETLERGESWLEEGSTPTVQYFAVSPDGTKIPYFVVRQGEADGPRPTLLTGYGGFRRSMRPFYDSDTERGWLARGGTFVLANIRGGGEYGPDWHTQAIGPGRHLSFGDFAAVAADLVGRGITTPAMLGIAGSSNGGLLTGVMLTRYPKLFGAVVSHIPLLDMRRYHQLPPGASWMAEYGNPDNPAEWAYLSKYSPYHNVHSGRRYPPALFLTATNDDLTHPAHARKMAAKMLEQGHKVHFQEDADGGHGNLTDEEQYVRRWALIFEFLWANLTDEQRVDRQSFEPVPLPDGGTRPRWTKPWIEVEAERVGEVDAERSDRAKTIVRTLLREDDLRRVGVFDEVVGVVASRLDPADLDRDEAATVVALEIGNDLGATRNG